jgi:sulfotransferase
VDLENMFVCLSGLPRSGSTLLSTILHQNPQIHAEGNSAVCQLMWDMLQSCEQNCNEQLIANNRFDTTYHLVNQIPDIYYQNTTRQVVVDKCRSWTLPANQDLLRRFVTDTPKTIVLTRPIDEIVASFAALYKQNGREFDESVLLREDSEPLMRSLRGVEWAKQVNKGEFLFITYKELVDDTDAVLDSVYGFIGVERFEHNLNNIVNVLPENDAVYGLIGMHNVRQTICSKEKVI